MRTTELTITRNGYLVLLLICFFFALLRGAVVVNQFLVLLGLAGSAYGIWWTMHGGLHRLPIPKGRIMNALPSSIALVPSSERPVVYTIRVPKGVKWNPNAAYQWMLKCLLHPHLVFRIEATAYGIDFQIVDLSLEPDDGVLQAAIRAIYPDAEVVASLYQPPPFEASHWRSTYGFQFGHEFFRPLLYARDVKDYDPLVVISNLMGGLREGERMSYNVFVGKLDEKAFKQGKRMITKQRVFIPLNPLSSQSWITSIFMSALGGREDKFSDSMDVFRDKLREGLFDARILIQVDTPLRDRLPHFEAVTPMLRFGTNFQTLVPIEYGGVEFIKEPNRHRAMSDVIYMSQWVNRRLGNEKTRMLLSPHELAALWHVPHDGFTSPRIAWAQTHTFVPMPVALRNQCEGVCLGENKHGSVKQRVYVAPTDRSMHTFLLGKTGVGKSTLMHNMIHQDIAEGNGVAVIDPKGDLVRDVLERSIPPWREADVVYIDFTNEANPPPLNLLSVPQGADATEAVGRVMSIFETMYEGFSGRMADTLYNVLLTLVGDATPTLRDVARLFRDADFRFSLIEKLDNEAALDFWAGFNLLSTSEQQNRADPVESRLRAFYGNKLLYPILCHPDRLDFGSLMRQGKIILVSFALDSQDGKIAPADQRLLGAVLVQQLQIAALAGEPLPTPFYIYIDETQHFVTTPLHQLLSEARSRNVALVLANQYLNQLAGDTLDAVLGNVGAMATFEIEEGNARQLHSYFRPNFEIDDLVNLGVHQAALRMRLGGKNLSPFSLATLPPPPKPEYDQTRRERIIEQSVASYMPKSRQEVMDWLTTRYPRPAKVRDTGQGNDPLWYDKGS